MVNRRAAVSDNTHNHPRKSGSSDQLFDIRSQLDMIHRLHTRVDVEHRKNRTLIAIVGMLMLIAEIASIITKLVKV